VCQIRDGQTLEWTHLKQRLHLGISAHNLNKVKTALSHRSAIFKRNKETDATETIKPAEENVWGDGVNIVRKCTPNRKPLNSAEKEEIVEKYNAGMSMADIGKQYDCHRVRISKTLKQMDVEIRGNSK
jgi:hypothetical protein